MKLSLKLASGAAALALSACQSLPVPSVSMPSVPTGIFGGGGNECPSLQAGPAEFTPPFPEACDGMNKTASGVRYIPISNGDINAGSPGPDATIVVSYQAFLAATGRQIDSSYQRGQSSVYQMDDLINGWAEAISYMNPGDEWLVFVPAAEAFGAEPLGDVVPANSDLVYRVHLEGFLSAREIAAMAAAESAPEPRQEPVPESEAVMVGPDMAAWQANFPWDPARESVTTLPSGVSIVLLERGGGERPPVEGERVSIHYEGRVAATSTFFDSSWSRGEPTEFAVGDLIPGFNEALKLMHVGDRVIVHIPADQAYGDRAVGEDIPPNSDLMFQIELLDIAG
ncbi:MAG: FKBP-type peptidyl-prolyl cis-trans isomerase [Pseudomonadota bacterium]